MTFDEIENNSSYSLFKEEKTEILTQRLLGLTEHRRKNALSTNVYWML